ncbi:hypothetical protein [uncultured Bradyrhizobium sp.]|jgi:hypothetical protein|uniref:hypothetical protein n=1 Tax=uncultured Bradyrhizobium sp. TaxID=199684 RepID=UPI002604FB37|nr:hypothetical protein [uncultured Bradyrhizobium sp.]
MIAASLGPCEAQCVEFSDRASQIDIDAFVKSPSSLLVRLRNDKEKLKYRLSTYVATNPAVLPSVQTLITESTTDDRSAIGSALRLAEARCTTTKPDAARKIKDFTKRIGDLSVQAGYSAVGEDDSGAPLPPRDKTSTQPSEGRALLEGEWKTKLSDPFKPVPIPQ